MNSQWNARKRNLLCMMLFFSFLCRPLNIAAETEDVIAEAKNGIVEIFSGFSDKNGTFYKMKFGSGFLISNAEGETYIVTNSSIIQNSDEEKRDYCESKKIAADDYAMADVIDIVIKGDVTVEASVLAKSENLDFCVLSVPNVVNEKVPLKLGNQADLSTGDVVYSFGFPSDIDGLEFSSKDVEIYQGNIQDKSSVRAGTSYIQHSAVVSDGNTGGPVLDEDGYVVGINCKEYTDAKSNRYYSLPADDLIEILDNFAVDYGSKKRDQLQKDFISLYEECMLLNESGKYKNASLAALQEALAEAGKLIEAENPSVAQMEPLYQSLAEAKDQLVPKMKKILIFIYVLAGLICVLFICLVWLLVLARKDKKSEMKTQTTFSDRKEVLEIIRNRNGQRVVADKPRYVIGKNPKQSDWFISDNPTISRMHACICWKNGVYELCDLGSSNGTYLKGNKLSKDIPVELKNGDLVILSDEEFTIQIRTNLHV